MALYAQHLNLPTQRIFAPRDPPPPPPLPGVYYLNCCSHLSTMAWASVAMRAHTALHTPTISHLPVVSLNSALGQPLHTHAFPHTHTPHTFAGSGPSLPGLPRLPFFTQWTVLTVGLVVYQDERDGPHFMPRTGHERQNAQRRLWVRELTAELIFWFMGFATHLHNAACDIRSRNVATLLAYNFIPSLRARDRHRTRHCTHTLHLYTALPICLPPLFTPRSPDWDIFHLPCSMPHGTLPPPLFTRIALPVLPCSNVHHTVVRAFARCHGRALFGCDTEPPRWSLTAGHICCDMSVTFRFGRGTGTKGV